MLNSTLRYREPRSYLLNSCCDALFVRCVHWIILDSLYHGFILLWYSAKTPSSVGTPGVCHPGYATVSFVVKCVSSEGILPYMYGIVIPSVVFQFKLTLAKASVTHALANGVAACRGVLVERLVCGCAAEQGSLFRSSGFTLAPYIYFFEKWFSYRVPFPCWPLV